MEDERWVLKTSMAYQPKIIKIQGITTNVKNATAIGFFNGMQSSITFILGGVCACDAGVCMLILRHEVRWHAQHVRFAFLPPLIFSEAMNMNMSGLGFRISQVVKGWPFRSVAIGVGLLQPGGSEGNHRHLRHGEALLLELLHHGCAWSVGLRLAWHLATAGRQLFGCGIFGSSRTSKGCQKSAVLSGWNAQKGIETVSRDSSVMWGAGDVHFPASTDRRPSLFLVELFKGFLRLYPLR